MKPLLIVTTLLLLLPAAVQAQTNPAFDPVPPGDHAYRDLSQLGQAGVIAYSDQFFASTGGHGTRYQFARVVADLLNVLQDKEVSQQTTTLDATSLRGSLWQHPQALAALIDLGQEFKPELVQIGVNWSASQERLNMLSAGADVNALQLAGIVISDLPRGAMTGRPIHTPQQFTDSVADFLTETFPSAEATPRIQRFLSHNLPALAALTRLVDQFAPELTARGFHIAAIQNQLASLADGRPLTIAPRFTDVPRSHWAYASVEALRKAGLIVGEGGGQFN